MSWLHCLICMSAYRRSEFVSCARRLSGDEEFVDASRPVMMQDFRKTLETFRPSGQHSQEYRQEQANTGQVHLAFRRI